MFQPSDDSLIRKALDGSERAWVALVARHERQVFNFCLRQTRNRSDASDLLQDVFLAVYRHLPSYRGEGDFMAWVMRIAAHKTTDLHRRQQRSPQYDGDPHAEEQMLEWQAPADFEPAFNHERSATNAAIRRQLQLLSPEQRLVVELKFFQHFTFEQIAAQTGVPVNTLKTRLYTALQKMKHQMEAAHAL